jgi:hypothetical protein
MPKVPGLTGALSRAAANKARFFDFLLERTGRGIVVDSSKHYLDGFSLQRAAVEKTRLILLVRDGRAVFSSGIRRNLGRDAALSAWSSIYSRCLPVFQKHLTKDQWLLVHYENFATDPARELRRICDFLGIGFEESMLAFAETEQHIANGNNMRFNRNSTVRLDERWREDLSAPMLAYFDRRAGALNRSLGYAADISPGTPVRTDWAH